MNKTTRQSAPQSQATLDSSLDPTLDAVVYAPRTAAASQDAGIVTRAALVVVLSLTLVGAMRWALNITNANARQISTGLTRLQGQYDVQEQNKRGGILRGGLDFPTPRPSRPSKSDTANGPSNGSSSGPSIEPEGR